MKYAGLLGTVMEYYEVSQRFIRYHRVPWTGVLQSTYHIVPRSTVRIMKYHKVPQNYTEFYRLPRSFMESTILHEDPRQSIKLRGTLGCFVYSMVLMVFHGTILQAMEHHGSTSKFQGTIPLGIVGYHGVSQSIKKYNRSTTEYHEVSWSIVQCQGGPRSNMEYFGVPQRNTIGHRGVPQSTKKYHGVTQETIEHHAIPRFKFHGPKNH